MHCLVYLFTPPAFVFVFQGLDEEAIVDHGKSSFTTHTNYETEDLESKFKANICLVMLYDRT